MLTCVTCTCYVTSWVGGVGCVNVHVNLRHMHMLRRVWVSPCWHHNCRMRADVDTDVKQEQDLLTCRHYKLHVVICFSYNQSAMSHQIGHTMQSCDQSQQPCEPKTGAKHQGVAMALDELQIKKPFRGHGSLFEEAHGDVRGGKHRAFSRANSL